MPTTVTVDPTAVIGTIHPYLFGHFVEHLGRCVYGGIYDPDSPHADAQGFRLDVLEAVRELAPTHIRYPGGNFVSGYHWRDGVGPKEARPVRFDHAWRTIETNHVGTHEFMDFARRLGSVPHFCVNLGNGSPEEAADWVEYCNASHDTTLTRMRAANGSPEPFGIPIWGLGNEINGVWQVGYKSAPDYAVVAREAALRMREVDPAITLIACGWENSQAWNAVILDTLAPLVDYLSLHLYIGDDDYYTALAQPLVLEQLSRWHAGLVRLICREKGLTKIIPLAWDEWNVWFRTESSPEGEIYSLKDALGVAGCLNALLRCADIVGMANLAQLVNVIAPIYTRSDAMFRQTTHWPLVLYRRLAGATSLRPSVACEGYRARYSFRTWNIDEEVPYLDVAAARSADGGMLSLGVVNRHRDAAIEAELCLVGLRAAAECMAETVTGPAPEVRNSFDQPDLVHPSRTYWSPDAARPRYTFPPHSLTMLTIPLG